MQKVQENAPNGTVIGTITTDVSNVRMKLIENANNLFDLKSTGELVVSK